MNEQPKIFRPILQPGETYELDGVPYKLITATSHMIGASADGIGLSEPLYWLDNLETNERVYMGEKELEAKLLESIFSITN